MGQIPVQSRTVSLRLSRNCIKCISGYHRDNVWISNLDKGYLGTMILRSDLINVNSHCEHADQFLGVLEFELSGVEINTRRTGWVQESQSSHNTNLTTMPLTEQQQLRCDAQVDRVVDLMTRRPRDTSYQNEYKTFCSWVEENGLREGDKYVHREAVERYFTEVVVLRTINKAGVSRIRSSLQWFHDNLESIAGDLVIRTNPVVNAAIAQQEENRANTPSTKLGVDPHKGIKDAMSLADKKKLAAYIIGSRRDWGSLNTSFCWGTNAGVRGASSRKFVYADIYSSVGFGPVKEGVRARTLLFILRKGGVHKDNFVMDLMVGSFRHRWWQLCSIGSLSLHTINQLRQDANINFLHEDKNARAGWWDKKVSEFGTLANESNAMAEVYDATGVKGCKLTHNRTYAVQEAGSEGLRPDQINTFTKHMLEKLFKSYQAAVDKEACKVMAGFAKDEAYFVEREFIEPQWEERALIDALLPRYTDWVAEHHSPDGDKSECCQHFLFEIIPFMVRVVVQDGIYLIRDFPEHEMANYLKVSSSNAWFCFFSSLSNRLSNSTFEFLLTAKNHWLRAVGSRGA